MKKEILFGIIVLVLVSYLLVLNVHPAKSLLIGCNGIYILNSSLNKEISTDKQAFKELKNYWTVYNPNAGCGRKMWVEDAVPSDMTVQQAIEEGILSVNQTIMLNNGQNVTGTWMLYQHRAIDKQGNVYFCKDIYSGNAPEISEKELSCGWYYGFEDQKKPGTLDNWTWSEGGRSSMWRAPDFDIYCH